MQQPSGLGQYSGSEQWRKALDVAMDLKATAEALNLPEEQQWLRYVLQEAAGAIRGSVLWAATSTPVPPAVDADFRIELGENPHTPSEAAPSASEPEEPTVTSLRQYVVAADATRGDAIVASYFVTFAYSQGVIEEATARRIGSALDDIEREMAAVSRELTGHLGFDPYQRSR